MTKKYYVIWKGRKKGIVTTWLECKSLVDGYSGAEYKSFSSLDEAQAAFKNKYQTKKNNIFKSPPITQEQIDAMPFDIKIFTDGACEPNPGEAGTGLAIYQNNKLIQLLYGLYQSSSTNNLAELNGLNHALVIAKDKLDKGYTVCIFCDSRYSIDCITTWASKWQKNGWTKSGGGIKNLDIIKSSYDIYQKIANQITIYHVNGHIGIEGNELADRMAVFAIDSKNNDLSQFKKIDNISEILSLRTG